MQERFFGSRVFRWAVITCAVAGLFPPWMVTNPNTGEFWGNVGYSLIFEPPDASAHIDYSKLLITWAIILMISWVLHLSIKSARDKKSKKTDE